MLKLLVFLGLLITAGGHAFAAEKSSERPRLENYDNPDRFITDVLAWERQHRQQENQQPQSEQKNSDSTDSGDWHDIDGPETLEGALRRARGYTPPDYEARYRFNRTTHLSFPLPRLEGDQMSGQAITGGLRQQALEQRSLEPLPEMRMILEEAGDEDELSVQDNQEFLPFRAGPRQKTVQVNAR